ncbi:hypothetical protein C8R45DRAFT_1107060 [Mycena sanguinolenta]|nr:hypothetical protein C8R45DRAFT_1107060 [Mycena sanguinolenta]
MCFLSIFALLLTLNRLKKEYQVLLKEVGVTGAGIDPADIWKDSKLENIFDAIRKKWPWWDTLHAFWRELPNYNPAGVQSSEPGTDHAGAAADLFDTKANPGSDVDADEEQDELEDGRSETSMARDVGDDSLYTASSDVDDDLMEIPALSTRSRSPTVIRSRSSSSVRSCSGSPVPPPSITKEVVPVDGKIKTKARTAVSRRDLGIAKANAAKPVTSSVATKNKPQNAIDRLHNLRESESARLGEKRQLQHKEEMERIKVKKMKYELKLVQARNESLRLSRQATSSRSPRRSTRVLNLGSPSPSKTRFSRASANLGSPSSSKIRSSRTSGVSRTPVHLSPSTFDNAADPAPVAPTNELPHGWENVDMSAMDFSVIPSTEISWNYP